jgi:glucuronate isomerase
MKPFMDENFLLNSDAARELYRGTAEAMPILDFHCHLSPREIAEDKRFENLTGAWLYGDHYKWRAMRLTGVEERLVTGPADDYDRFLAWAATMPALVGNPLFNWTQLELKRYFGIDDVLTPRTAPGIWKRANAQLSKPGMGAQGLMERSNVKAVCTTDDPADSLEWHAKIKAQGLPFRVYPAWRPDKALNIDKPGFAEYIATLGASAGVKINDWDGLLAALDSRMAHFSAAGCRLSDHGFARLPFEPCTGDEAARLFARALAGETPDEAGAARYKTALMLFLGEKYAERGWAMQLHMGALRNNNARMFERLGPDTGYDAVGDWDMAAALSRLLDTLDSKGKLPRTVLYTLNPKDFSVLAALTGCFHEAGVKGKVQFGPAWWFLDSRDGMERQMTDLANMGMLSAFVGMLTDSRSFLSYTRHEYFRRIFCNLLGRWVENGECPWDMDILEPMVRGVCYENAERYFGFGK